MWGRPAKSLPPSSTGCAASHSCVTRASTWMSTRKPSKSCCASRASLSAICKPPLHLPQAETCKRDLDMSHVVLVVDDVSTVLELARRLLELRGYCVLTAQ